MPAMQETQVQSLGQEDPLEKGIKGTFHARMGTIKGRNDKDITEAEDIKKRWQEYPVSYLLMLTFITALLWQRGLHNSRKL